MREKSYQRTPQSIPHRKTYSSKLQASRFLRELTSEAAAGEVL